MFRRVRRAVLLVNAIDSEVDKGKQPDKTKKKTFANEWTELHHRQQLNERRTTKRSCSTKHICFCAAHIGL